MKSQTKTNAPVAYVPPTDTELTLKGKLIGALHGVSDDTTKTMKLALYIIITQYYKGSPMTDVLRASARKFQRENGIKNHESVLFPDSALKRCPAIYKYLGTNDGIQVLKLVEDADFTNQVSVTSLLSKLKALDLPYTATKLSTFACAASDNTQGPKAKKVKEDKAANVDTVKTVNATYDGDTLSTLFASFLNDENICNQDKSAAVSTIMESINRYNARTERIAQSKRKAG
jgi:hypothetical protein